jgi:hypothetical protein
LPGKRNKPNQHKKPPHAASQRPDNHDKNAPSSTSIKAEPKCPLPKYDKQNGEHILHARSMRRIGIWLNVITGVGIAVGLGSLFYLSCQVSISQQEFTMSQRPWLSLQLAPSKIPQYSVTDTGASINVDAVIENVGHSIALHTQYWTYLKGVQEITRNECQLSAKESGEYQRQGGGFAVFPGKPFKHQWPSITNESPRKPLRGGVAIIGCVQYRSSFSDKVHHTQIIYEITTTDEGIDTNTGQVLDKPILGFKVMDFGVSAD